MSRALEASSTPPAALGLRAHSGWAALVVVAGPRSSPAVVDRRRIELIDPRFRGRSNHTTLPKVCL